MLCRHKPVTGSISVGTLPITSTKTIHLPPKRDIAESELQCLICQRGERTAHIRRWRLSSTICTQTVSTIFICKHGPATIAWYTLPKRWVLRSVTANHPSVRYKVSAAAVFHSGWTGTNSERFQGNSFDEAPCWDYCWKGVRLENKIFAAFAITANIYLRLKWKTETSGSNPRLFHPPISTLLQTAYNAKERRGEMANYTTNISIRMDKDVKAQSEALF